MIIHFFKLILALFSNRIHIVYAYIIRQISMVFRIIKSMILVSKCSKNSMPNHDLRFYYCDKGKINNNKRLQDVNNNLDLSIIIPTYNVASYIDQCIQSVINQETRFLYEVILIDDGSTDGTFEIIKKYSKEPGFKVIRQDNAGQSAARNNGIYRSDGKYFMFVDADDILLPNAIDSLLSVAIDTDSDIAEGRIVRFYNEITNEMICKSEGIYHIESNATNPGFVLTSYGYSVAKVFRRTLWETLRYPEGYIFEDVITKFILRRKANKVVFIKNVVYGYRMNNPNSSSHKANKMKKLDSIWVLPKVFLLCEQERVPRDEIFYLLALNHIGLLNYITVRSQITEIKLACFCEMRKQLLSIKDCRPQKIPFLFTLLEKSILENDIKSWEYIAETINRYQLLKRWREIN